MKRSISIYKVLGDAVISHIIGIGLFIVPAVSVWFALMYPFVAGRWLFLLFMCFLSIERTWETFYSTGDCKKHKLQGDWTLPVVSLAYLVMVFGVIWEFFIANRNMNFVIVILGLGMFVSSLLLRLYSMRTLKEQWSVHAVGAKKVRKVSLIQSGPYRYIRHPIYLGVILEVLSIPLIWNAYLMVAFACVINVPLQIIRACLEERSTVRKLGKDYVAYKNKVPAFLPIKFSKEHD